MKRVTAEAPELAAPFETVTNSTHTIDTLLSGALSPKRDGASVGTLAGFSDTGQPLVSVSDDTRQSLAEARSCVRLVLEDVGRCVVLLFEDNCPSKPIVVGMLEAPGVRRELKAESTHGDALDPITVELDGNRVVLSAKEEIVLRCGGASLTLTSAGKILMRGAYVSSHSAGVNRVKGASVEIN
jgi:hypothetical protein